MTIDIDAIRQRWLNQCGYCDAGLIMSCNHPDDYRPTLSALCDEIERLRAERGEGHDHDPIECACELTEADRYPNGVAR